jgi:hypothetical protein
MADQWVELLVNAADRQAAETFARRLAQRLPTLEVLIGSGPEVPASAPAPPRYVVWALVGDVGGTPATRAATSVAVSEVLNELDVTIDTGPAADALDMTVVFVS